MSHARSDNNAMYAEMNASTYSSLSVGGGNNPDIDTLLLAHRRKMLRRAANRRSAKLSRARKKAHMEDLKAENAKLQRLVDVLDSQPELLFCVTVDGRITFMSERALNHFQNCIADDSGDPTHINQILTMQSVNVFYEALETIKGSDESNIYGDLNQVSNVKEICYLDCNGYQAVGYLRLTKVQRKFNENDDPFVVVDEESETTLPPPKKAKKQAVTAPVKVSSSSRKGSMDSTLECLEAALDDNEYLSLFNGMSDNGHSNLAEFFVEYDNALDANQRNEHSPRNEDRGDDQGIESDEYVCVIRPASHSLPHNGEHANIMSLAMQSTHKLHEQVHSFDLLQSRQRGQFNLTSGGEGNTTDAYSTSDSASNSNSNKNNGNNSTNSSSDTNSDNNGELDSDFYC